MSAESKVGPEGVVEELRKMMRASLKRAGSMA